MHITLPRVNTEALGTALTEAARAHGRSAPAAQAYDAVVRFDDALVRGRHYRAGLALERLVEIINHRVVEQSGKPEEQRRILNQRSYDQPADRLDPPRHDPRDAGPPHLPRRRALRAPALATQSGIQSAELDGARERLAALGDTLITRCRTQRPGAAR